MYYLYISMQLLHLQPNDEVHTHLLGFESR